MAQEADTLETARVVSAYPVQRPAEELYLPSVNAAPSQVADVLRRFTGVQVKDYGGAGGLKTVNVRSLGSEHVGVFLDGIQIDNAQNMQVDLGRFGTDWLGNIALYNGQKINRLQTAKEYSCGAAVHLSGVRPSGDGGSVRLRGGSFGTVNPSAMVVKRLGHVDLQAAAEFLYSNGRYPFRYFDTTLVRENGDIRSLRLDTQLSGSIPRGEWQLRLYGYGSERGFPGPVIRRAAQFPFSAERQADQDFFAQGSWKQDWTDRYSTAVRMKYADNYTHYDTHPERNPMALPYDLHYRQQSGYLSVAQSLTLASWASVDLATDVQRNALDADVGGFVTPRRTVFTGALAGRMVWERFRLGASVSYVGAWDEFDTPAAGGWSRDNAFRDAWMPSVAMTWLPLEWLEAGLFARRSYRLPSFNDLYYSLMGNSALQPESALQIGGDLRFSGRWWDVRVAPYWNRVSEKIVAIPTISQFRWTMLNIGLVDVTGLDLRGHARRSFGGMTLDGAARYSLQQALDHSDPSGSFYGNQIPYIPLHSGSLDASAEWRGWTAAVNCSFTGERWSRSANTADYHINPWTTTDVAFGKVFALGRRTDKAGMAGSGIGGRDNRAGGISGGSGSSRSRGQTISVRLQLNNIFDARYDIVQGYPMPGFHCFLSVEYRW